MGSSRFDPCLNLKKQTLSATVPTQFSRFALKENEGENMKFFDAGMLKDLSTEDMERLGREIKNLHRRVCAELDTRERFCAHCGQRLGASVYSFRYCSAWHRYLDGHKNESTVSRIEFERKRAISRIRTIKNEAESDTALSDSTDVKEAAELFASLKNLRIKRVLNEFRAITGESLKKPIRGKRRFKASDQDRI
jgi:hypothetical protein